MTSLCSLVRNWWWILIFVPQTIWLFCIRVSLNLNVGLVEFHVYTPWTSIFLAPGTSFMENNFFTDWGRQHSGRMVLGWFKCITFIVYFISIIDTLWYIVKQSYSSPQFRISRDSELVFLQLDSPIWRWLETLQVCCLYSVYSVISFWLLSLQKTLLNKDRMLEMEAGIRCS